MVQWMKPLYCSTPHSHAESPSLCCLCVKLRFRSEQGSFMARAYVLEVFHLAQSRALLWGSGGMLVECCPMHLFLYPSVCRKLDWEDDDTHVLSHG